MYPIDIITETLCFSNAVRKLNKIKRADDLRDHQAQEEEGNINVQYNEVT